MKRITLRVAAPTLVAFDAACEALCIKKDPFIAKYIGAQLDALEQRPANDARDALYEARMRRAYATVNGIELVPITPTLPIELVDRMDQLCALKREPRNMFFEQVLEYLTERLVAAHNAL